MSAAKHTPGPWVWQHWPDGQNTVATQATLGTVANVWTSGAGVDIDKANARLMAAAPELLDLLRQCRDYLSCIPESAVGGDDDAVLLTSNADKLIAKVMGSAA